MWERVVFYVFWVRVLGIRVCFAHFILDGVSGVCVIIFGGVGVVWGVWCFVVRLSMWWVWCVMCVCGGLFVVLCGFYYCSGWVLWICFGGIYLVVIDVNVVWGYCVMWGVGCDG